MEDELCGKSRLNQILLDNMPCVAMLLRPLTREIVASNQAAVEAGAVPGVKCFATWGQRDNPCPWCLAPELWKTGQPQHLEVEAIGVVWDAYWAPVGPNLYLHYAFDITDRKRLEGALRESDETLRALLNAIPESKVIVAANETLAQRLGKGLDELVGSKISEMLPSEVAKRRKAYIDEVLRTGKAVRFEDMRDGRFFDHLIHPIMNAEGKVSKLALLSLDITERKRAEVALRESEKLYRSLFENMLNGFAYCKMLFEQNQPQDFIYLSINHSFEVLTGLKNVVGKKISEIIPGLRDSDPRLFEIFGRVALTGYPERFEIYVAALTMWFSVSVYSPEKEYFVAVFDMITERKQAEEALRESEARLAKAERVARLGYWDMDLKNQKLSWSMEVYRLFAKDPDTFVPTFETFLATIHPEDRGRFLHIRDEALAEGRGFTVDYRIVMPDGSFRFMQEIVELTGNGVGNPIRIFGTIQDITECKQAEEELRSTRDYLESIFANSVDGIGIVDRHGKVTRWNKAAEELYGFKFDELKGRSAIDLYADPGEYYVMLKRLLQDGFIRNYEINMKKKDGSVFPASLSIKVLRNSDNEIIGSITGCRDLTEIKRTMMHLQNEIYQHEQARQALLESEQKLINIIDFLPEATFVIDTNGKVIAWNKAIEEMTGIKAKDMVGKGNYEYALPFHGERRRILIDLVLEPEKGIDRYDEVKSEDGALMAVAHLTDFRGKETYLFGKASALIDSHGKIIGSIESVRDITALRKAEADRLQFSKLESMSILAGGIAHDFNNILTSIFGNIGLAMLNRNLGEEGMESLMQAEQACFRAQELSGQLLTFAKGGAPIKKVMSLVKLVGESAKLALAGSKSLCELSFPDNIWSVEADEGQINQVINNLLINADQSMPSGGIIKIGAENVILEEGSDLPLSEGKYVKLTITDQGIGIPSKYLDKVFDPYFTTKQKGSGLGLATAYSIIKKHSGHIKVESQLGVGTDFEIYLPAKGEEPIAAFDEQVTPIIGQGKVLVMDDDAKIREILCRMLGRLGYEADSASDGSQALEKFANATESGRPFDTVILDLTVPGGMGGKETMEKLLRIDPQVKAIVSSGYSDDPVMADFQKYGFSEVIAKPYRVVELSKILQRVISKKGERSTHPG